MMPEEWRKVADDPRYEVSNAGRVRSSARGPLKILSPGHDSAGYPTVQIRVNGKPTTARVHVLVCEAFIGPRPAGQMIRHLNDVKSDNRVENLSYGSSSDNHHDSVLNGTHGSSAKTRCPSGHPYSSENTIIAKRGNGSTFRMCKICNRESGIRYRERKRNAKCDA